MGKESILINSRIFFGILVDTSCFAMISFRLSFHGYQPWQLTGWLFRVQKKICTFLPPPQKNSSNCVMLLYLYISLYIYIYGHHFSLCTFLQWIKISMFKRCWGVPMSQIYRLWGDLCCRNGLGFGWKRLGSIGYQCQLATWYTATQSHQKLQTYKLLRWRVSHFEL